MKNYRVELLVGIKKFSVKTWAETPQDAIEKATKENKIENYEVKSVKEL